MGSLKFFLKAGRYLPTDFCDDSNDSQKRKILIVQERGEDNCRVKWEFNQEG